MTPRQLEILRMIRDFQNSNGYSPTMQELAEALGVTKVTVFEHVGTLVDKGLLRRSPHKARSLELTGRVEFPEEQNRGMPILGHIAAGVPIEPAEDQDTLNLAKFFESRYETFVLRVRGESMIDDQIRSGDYVVCERRTEARQGETVVAMLPDGEVTLKRYYREKTRIRLQPANPEFKPIYAKRVDVQGIVLGVLRAYG
jgi:repressor LexA